MLVWKFDTCACAFEVDREFKLIRAVNICADHKRDTEAESFKEAHEYNQAINRQKALEAEDQAE